MSSGFKSASKADPLPADDLQGQTYERELEHLARTDFNPGNISVKDVLNAHRRELEKARISCRRKKRGPTLAAPAISYFRADELENVAAEHPGVSAEEVLQILEQKWKKMDKTARRPYLQLAARDQARYAEEKRNYIPKSAGGNMKKPKKKKHPDAPKHPRCAYLFFVAENRELLKKKNPQLTFTEIAKMLGEMWKNMTPEEKSRFEIMAEEDKEKYRKAKDKFPEPVTIVTPDPDPFGYSDKAEVPSAPKHPASAYLFFVASNRQRLQEVFPDKSFTDTARILGILWRQLSREDRRKFELLAAADKRRYEEEKLAWEPPADTFSSFTRSFGNVTQTIEAEKEKKFNSAYAIWASAERAAVLQDHPDMDRKELTKLLKETWKSLAYHEKLPFITKAEALSGEPRTAAKPISSFASVFSSLEAKEKEKEKETEEKHKEDELDTMDIDCPAEISILSSSSSPEEESSLFPSESAFMFSDIPLLPDVREDLSAPLSLNLSSLSSSSNGNVHDWDSHDVGRFIASIGLAHLSEQFVQSGIRGDDFIRLTTKDMKTNFGIASLGDRKKIRSSIEEHLLSGRS